MKKGLCLSVLFCLFFNMGVAQETSFGIKGGLNYATLREDFTENFSSRTLFHMGVFGEFPSIAERFFLRPEIVVSFQGFKSDLFDTNVNLTYLNIPIIFKYYFAKNVSIGIGPKVGFLLNDVNQLRENGVFFVRKSDSGIFVIDSGTQFEFGLRVNEKADIQLRYFLGHSNFFKVNDWKRFNSVFQLSLSYKLSK